jgi:hypothetical protein
MTSNSGRRGAPTSSNNFFNAAHASLYPSGAEALARSYDSLGQIDKALGDLVLFWKHHVEQMMAVSRQQTKLPFTREESRSLAGVWGCHKPALQEAISSISFSMSAAEVEPTGASYPGHSPQNEGSQPQRGRTPGGKSILKKLFGGLFGGG